MFNALIFTILAIVMYYHNADATDFCLLLGLFLATNTADTSAVYARNNHYKIVRLLQVLKDTLEKADDKRNL